MRKVLLGDFLSVYRIEHIVEDNKTYKQVTISKHDGVSCRGEKLGRNIGRKRQFIIDLDLHPHTVLFTRQGVIDGSIGLATANVNKCIVTENMPMMSVNTDVIEIGYLKKLLISDYLLKKIRKLTIVGSAQKSIHERDFLNIEIELPNKDIQTLLCSKFSALDEELESLNLEISNQQSILKKLRQQILQDAIKGKLTTSWRMKNEDIETASQLIERIAIADNQPVNYKKAKSLKPLITIKDNEKPFELPEKWVWCPLGEIAYGFQYGTSSKSLVIGKVPVLRMGNIQNGDISWDGLVFSNDNNEIEQYKVEDGDLLFNRTNSRELVGKTALFRGGRQSIFAGYLVRFRMALDISPEYANFVMNSKLHTEWCNEVKTDALGQSNINATKLRMFRFPLPPVLEQRMIVEKVKKLIALCDQLEVSITDNQHHAAQLMQAVLREAFSQEIQVSELVDA